MSMAIHELEAHGELAPADVATPTPRPAPILVPLPASAASQTPAIVRPLPSAGMPVGRSTRPSTLDRVQLLGNRAVAEVAYQLRRAGTAMLAGSAAIVLAAIIFVTGNIPQGSAVTALKGELGRQIPVRHITAGEGPSGGMLASLPTRAEAPSVVEKILEEA